MLSGAWAELVAVDTGLLAELPDRVSFEQAATLPVAGLTALRALEIGDFVLGKRVLVTGASGGVGRFAIQLAKLAGAHVTALARRTAGRSELGADEIIETLEPEGPTFEVIIDAVGGATLGAVSSGSQSLSRLGSLTLKSTWSCRGPRPAVRSRRCWTAA